MPVLRKYKDKENYFVLTSISGKVVTFQLTEEGMRRLKEAGIVPDQPFERALLWTSTDPGKRLQEQNLPA